MSLFDMAHTTSYSPSIVSYYVYLVLFLRYSELIVESRKFLYPTRIWH